MDQQVLCSRQCSKIFPGIFTRATVRFSRGQVVGCVSEPESNVGKRLITWFVSPGTAGYGEFLFYPLIFPVSLRYQCFMNGADTFVSFTYYLYSSPEGEMFPVDSDSSTD